MKHPFEVLKLFDVTIVSVAKAMMQERTGSVGDNAAAMAVALSQLRKLKARETPLVEAWNRCSEFPELKEALKDKEHEDTQEVLQNFISRKTEQRIRDRVAKV